jgi:hypothetical protein
MADPRLPDSGRPSYWTALPEATASGYGNVTVVVVAGVILLIFAALISFAGAVTLLSGDLWRLVLPAGREADFFRSAAVVAGAVLLLVGILQGMSAIGIFRHRAWGRLLGIVLAALWCLLGVVALFGSFAARETIPASGTTTDPSSGLASGAGLLVIYGFVLLALLFGGRHFAHRPTS